MSIFCRPVIRRLGSVSSLIWLSLTYLITQEFVLAFEAPNVAVVRGANVRDCSGLFAAVVNVGLSLPSKERMFASVREWSRLFANVLTSLM